MAKTSEPRERLLRQASQIFYTEGIHAIGVDRIIADAQSTRATFYRHFPGKESLVVAYLQAADAQIRAQVAEVVADRPAVDAVRAVAAGIAGQIGGAGFRGCAFINAVTEYPDPSHPVHRVVVEHRDWFLKTAIGLFGDESTGRQFVMLRDGAMTAGCISDAEEVVETFLSSVEGILRSHAIGASATSDG